MTVLMQFTRPFTGSDAWRIRHGIGRGSAPHSTTERAARLVRQTMGMPAGLPARELRSDSYPRLAVTTPSAFSKHGRPGVVPRARPPT